MISSNSLPDKYKTSFTDGKHESVTDAPTSLGGKGEGFKPPVLLEASLATCINTVIRVAAEGRGIPLEGVRVDVSMDDSGEQTVFTYKVELAGQLSAEQRESLLRAVHGCPVKKALLKPLVFKAAE